MQKNILFDFKASVWQHNGGGWFFVSLPEELSNEIRENLQWQEEGWGRMKAKAECNEVNWETAIWYDTKHKTYILPLKADVRKKAKLSPNDEVEVSIWL